MGANRRKRSSEVTEAIGGKKNSNTQSKKTRWDEKEQGSEQKETACSRMRSPKKVREAFKVARSAMKKEARQSLPRRPLALSTPSEKVLQVPIPKKIESEASKAIVERQRGLPLMDELLPVALGKVAAKGVVTGKVLVEHVAKTYPELGAKVEWVWKLKAAVHMEVVRGKLHPVSGLGLCG